MTSLQVIILAIVEGFTEFLPISSTGHLILISKFLAIKQTEFLKSFEVFIQLGAIFAVIFLYKSLLLHGTRVLLKILTAFLPTGVVGLVFYGIIKQYLLGNEYVTLVSLFTGGVLLIVIEYFHKDKDSVTDLDSIPLKYAFYIGIFQSLSVIPGVSRAAATIIGSKFLGLSRKTAVEFSFLLAIPTMLAASGYDLLKSSFSFTRYEYSMLGMGFIGSFFVALFALKFLLKFIQNHSFIPFGIYRITLSVLYWYFLIL